MNMTIHCPHCEAQLTVPDDAGGRAARCPKCRSKFRVPGFDALLDETVAAWLFTPEPEPEPDPVKAEVVLPLTPPPTRTESRPTTRPEPQPAVPAAAPALAHDDAPAPLNGAAGSHGPPALPIQPLSADAAGPVRLQVDAVSAAGVSILFPSHYLLLTPFRASLPLECIQCGHDETSQLLARPLGFHDRSRGAYAGSGEIEARFETQLAAGARHEEIVEAMTIMTELASPFDHPTPYFVCGRCASKVAVACRTVTGREGPECRVQIPSGAYALAWLGRVNGICGEDYTQLAQRIHGEAKGAWQSVPPHVRQRLSNWCAFKQTESFVAYLPDSDFTARDAGFAGIVLTNLRMIFCKHHTRGSLALDTAGELTLLRRGHFYDLNHRDSHRSKRLARLRRKHGIELMETLGTLGSPLRVIHAVAS